jgi:hypothetical protein
MHYERAALLNGKKRHIGQESEEKIGKAAEEMTRRRSVLA